jgi:hypothetical protein
LELVAVAVGEGIAGVGIADPAVVAADEIAAAAGA